MADFKEMIQKVEDLTPALMVEYKVPGVSVTLIEENAVAYRGCFGLKKAGEDASVAVDTVFEAASMSKPVFAYVVLRMVEADEFDLDRPLVQYLGKPYLEDEPLHEKITGRMVLTHTGGFPNWREGGLKNGGPLPVLFEPGSAFEYSGEGFWFLQQTVEHLLGEQMDPFVKRTLFEPLQMDSSSYVWQDRYEILVAAGHDQDGEFKPDRPLYGRDNAAYTLYTTPTDYAQFLIEVMTADGSAAHSLNREAIENMLSPYSRRSEWVQYGLGWALCETDHGVQCGYSGSNGTGFRCVSRFNPHRGRGFVIMTNASSGASLWEKLVEELGELHRLQVR